MSIPLVSIIIPTYNRAGLINATLDSVLAQTYENWECIIVDDGSTDNTAKVVQEYVEKDSRFQFFHRPPDRQKGANACRNYGFELTKGKYVNWFDSDDLMLNNKLKIQVDALENSGFNFTVCQTLMFEGDVFNILGLRHKKINSGSPLLDFIKHEIAFLTQAPFFKVKFLKDIGLKFDEDLHAAQEWEFICRLLYYSPTYHIENKPLVYIRKHKDSITYNDDFNYREWNYYLAREKIFYFFKSKENFYSKIEIINYLEKYFKNYFNTILFKNEYKKIIRVFIKSIVPFNSIYKNIKSILVLALILLTGKGYKYRKLI